MKYLSSFWNPCSEYPDYRCHYLVNNYTCYNGIHRTSLNKTSLTILIPIDSQEGPLQFYQNFNRNNQNDLGMCRNFTSNLEFPPQFQIHFIRLYALTGQKTEQDRLAHHQTNRKVFFWVSHHRQSKWIFQLFEVNIYTVVKCDANTLLLQFVVQIENEHCKQKVLYPLVLLSSLIMSAFMY